MSIESTLSRVKAARKERRSGFLPVICTPWGWILPSSPTWNRRRRRIRRCRHGWVCIRSSGISLLLFSCTPLSKKCSLNIVPQSAAYCKHKDISLLHQGFKDRGYHRKNYSTFYCGRANRGWILYPFLCLSKECTILLRQLKGNSDLFTWRSIFYWGPCLKDWFCSAHKQLHQD